MKLVENGQTKVSIVLPDQAGQVERFAATELARYLGQISGAKVEIGPASVGGLVPIHLGLRDQLNGVGDLPESKPGFDGYVVVVGDDRIVISGDNPRGALYGTYDILERMGCRWYYPTIDPADPEIIPSMATVDLPPFSTAEASPIKYRVCHPSSMIYQLHVADALAQTDWAAKARYNVMLFLLTARALEASGAETPPTSIPAQAMEEHDGDEPIPGIMSVADFWEGTKEYETTGIAPAMRDRGMLLEGPNHCMVFLLPNSLFKEHPDWFGMDDQGQRRPQAGLGPEFCWGNPEAVERFTDNCVQWLQANPHLNVFSCAPNDGGKACKCERCTPSTPTDLYANLCNVLIAKIRAAGLPVELEILGGYNPVTDPPVNVALDPEIRVHWAHWGRGHDQFYGDPSYAMRENLDRWLAAANPFTMVNYYTDAFATPPIFPPVAVPMAADDKWLEDQGVAGIASLMFPHASWWAYTLNGWLAIAWFYADRSPLAFLDDYASHYFGAAGEPMVEYHRILTEEMWLGYYCQGARWCEPIWAGPEGDGERARPLLDRLETLLDEAEKLAREPLDVYRLSRLAATGRVLIMMGRARIENMPLVRRLEQVRKGETADATPLADAMRVALVHEEEVIEPAVRALLDLVGVLPVGFESQKLMGSSAAVRADLETL